MQPNGDAKWRSETMVLDGYRVRGITQMCGGVSQQMIGGTALNPGGVSLTVVEISPCICASGSEGAVAVGIPTERSGARSHAVGMDAEAPKVWHCGRKGFRSPAQRIVSL
jgi:hypothetical protein